MTEYVLVFDARTAPLVRPIDFIGLLLAVVLCLVYWVSRRRGGKVRPHTNWFFASPWPVAAAVTLAVGVSGLGAALNYADVTWLQKRLRTGEYERVEGRVEDFIPGDRGGHHDETWAVRSGGRTYRYRLSSARVVPGFHQSAGLIREGIWVRLADVDGYIAHLEIARGEGDVDRNP